MDKVFLGVNDRGLACYASESLIAEKGMAEVREQTGVVRRYPVKTDLSGNVMMVVGDSHEDAVARYLNRVESHNAALTGAEGVRVEGTVRAQGATEEDHGD